MPRIAYLQVLLEAEVTEMGRKLRERMLSEFWKRLGALSQPEEADDERVGAEAGQPRGCDQSRRRATAGLRVPLKVGTGELRGGEAVEDGTAGARNCRGGDELMEEGSGGSTAVLELLATPAGTAGVASDLWPTDGPDVRLVDKVDPRDRGIPVGEHRLPAEVARREVPPADDVHTDQDLFVTCDLPLADSDLGYLHVIGQPDSRQVQRPDLHAAHSMDLDPTDRGQATLPGDLGCHDRIGRSRIPDGPERFPVAGAGISLGPGDQDFADESIDSPCELNREGAGLGLGHGRGP